jgi:quercetin dioxygenase-like cupin family protein
MFPAIRAASAGLLLLVLSLAHAPAAAAPSGVEPPGKHLGGPFTLAETTGIHELTRHPAAHFNRTVRIEGVVASCCTQEGCFIEVAPDDGGEGILVNFPDLTPLFPTDCAGARAVVEGTFYQKIYPASRVRHWQGHSFRPGRAIPEFSAIPRLSATAASIGGTKGPVPPPADIVPARTDRIALATMEFETEGFGAGRKQLAAGDSTETHSSGNAREIVLCLEGTLTVLEPGAEPVTIGPGEMTFIPPATRHALRNSSDRPASYVFVFARQIEPEKPHEH